MCPTLTCSLLAQMVARSDTGRVKGAKYDDLSKYNDAVVTHANWFCQLATVAEGDIPLLLRQKWANEEQVYAEGFPDAHLVVRRAVHEANEQRVNSGKADTKVRHRPPPSLPACLSHASHTHKKRVH